MEEQLISLETAILAKEKGFDWRSDRYYHEQNPLCTKEDYTVTLRVDKNREGKNFKSYAWQYSAPTQSLLQKWLEEEYNFYLQPLYYHKNYSRCVIIVILKLINIDTEEEEFKEISRFLRIPIKEWKEKGLQEALKLI